MGVGSEMQRFTQLDRPLENRLLLSLPVGDYERILPNLEKVSLRAGAVIHEPGGHLEHIYFPSSAIVSFLHTVHDGATAEVGIAGKEGAVGVALFLGGDTMPHRAMVQAPGGAFRMPAAALRDEFARAGPFQRVLLLYAQVFLTQIAQTAVCNRLHAIEKRLCRWLLLCHDRASSDELLMTQEFMGKMLGGRRESVTLAARRLQEMRLIRYSRGHITILNRGRLEECACECYRTVRNEFDRLFPARHETAAPAYATAACGYHEERW